MHKKFITYEQSLIIKQLGFNDSCCGKYHGDDIIHEETKHGVLSAPTYAQATEFLLNLINLTTPENIEYLIELLSDYTGKIYKTNSSNASIESISEFKTRNQMIKKLINIKHYEFRTNKI